MPDVIRQVGLLGTRAGCAAPVAKRGVRVLHQVMDERRRRRTAINCRIFAAGEKLKQRLGHGAAEAGSPGVELVDELDVPPSDVRVTRMTPFTGTELDAIIRNLHARTIVLMGSR